MALMSRYEDNHFDLAIVDPPYGIGMDGGNVGYKGFNNFEKKGWAEPTIVIRFWIISIILALIGLATLKLR